MASLSRGAKQKPETPAPEVSEGFPGERPGHRMRKLARSNPNVTCGSCRQFDGLAWCRRWNFHTTAESPICDQYRPVEGAR